MRGIAGLLLLACIAFAQYTPPGGGVGNGTGSVTSVGITGTAGQITVTGTCTGTVAITCELSIPSVLALPGTINKITITQPATGATFTLVDGKTLTVSNSLALTGSDGSSVAFGAGGTVVYTSTTVNGHALSGNVTVTNADLGAVPTTTTVNGHALSGNVTVTNADLGAVPTTATVNGHALSSNVTVTNADLGAVPTTTTVNGHALSGNVAVTTTDLGLNNVTNDVQTQAAIVPNTAPTAGQVPCGNAGNTAYAPCTVSGDGTLASTGVLTNLKINGVAFPSGPSVHMIPIITSAGNVTWKVLPNCTDTGGNHINYDTSTDTLSCGTSSSGGGGAGVSVSTVASASSMTFTMAASTAIQTFRVSTLQHSPTITITTTSATNGQIVIFDLLNDGAGGYTWAWPTNVQGGCAIDTGANQQTVTDLRWDSTLAKLVTQSCTYPLETNPVIISSIGTLKFPPTSATMVGTIASVTNPIGGTVDMYSTDTGPYNGITCAASPSAGQCKTIGLTRTAFTTTLPLPSGMMNVANRKIEVTACFYATTGGGSPTTDVRLLWDAVAIVGQNPTAPTTSLTDNTVCQIWRLWVPASPSAALYGGVMGANFFGGIRNTINQPVAATLTGVHTIGWDFQYSAATAGYMVQLISADAKVVY